MREYKDLTPQHKAVIINLGIAYFQEHRKQIRQLLLGEDNAVAPSGSDMYHPELWKPMHWLWFMKETG